MLRFLKIFVLLFVVQFFNLYGQSEFTIATYNLLKFSTTSGSRCEHFNMILDSIAPDILVVQEMVSFAAVQMFYSCALDTTYSIGDFIDGPDTDNAIFYRHSRFKFISNTAIPTNLRDINEFKLVFRPTSDTLRIFSVHLRAGTGTTNENQRLIQVNSLRNYTNTLPPNTSFIVCGDFNFYKSSEPGYQALLLQQPGNEGHFIDPVNITGTWNNPAYAIYHTQSTRTRQFGGGATGGLDDRFDLILFSQAIANPGKIDYVPNSLWAFGNDGLHYKDSINRPPNLRISQALANALHLASDHLPVIARFRVQSPKIEIIIPLNQGWNAVSTFFQPDPASLQEILAPVSNQLIACMTMEGLYYPAGEIYSIINWEYQNGYLLKMAEPVNLVIEGSPLIDPEFDITPGWNLFPILSSQPVDLAEYFGNNLTKVVLIREASGLRMWWPEMEIFSLQSVEPGKSYWLQSSGSFTIKYP